MITFDNGARAVAEASFSATYGYDVRGEVFGSGGMVTVGDQAPAPLVAARRRPAGRRRPCAATSSCSCDAYTGEFVEFVAAVREGRPPAVTGEDARRALAIALACIESVAGATHPVTIAEADR